jgi:hypothetical protein
VHFNTTGRNTIQIPIPVRGFVGSGGFSLPMPTLKKSVFQFHRPVGSKRRVRGASSVRRRPAVARRRGLKSLGPAQTLGGLKSSQTKQQQALILAGPAMQFVYIHKKLFAHMFLGPAGESAKEPGMGRHNWHSQSPSAFFSISLPISNFPHPNLTFARLLGL